MPAPAQCHEAELTNSTILNARNHLATTVEAQHHDTRGLISGLATRQLEADRKAATLEAERRSLRYQTFTFAGKADVMEKTTLRRMDDRLGRLDETRVLVRHETRPPWVSSRTSLGSRRKRATDGGRPGGADEQDAGNAREGGDDRCVAGPATGWTRRRTHTDPQGRLETRHPRRLGGGSRTRLLSRLPRSAGAPRRPQTRRGTHDHRPLYSRQRHPPSGLRDDDSQRGTGASRGGLHPRHTLISARAWELAHEAQACNRGAP